MSTAHVGGGHHISTHSDWTQCPVARKVGSMSGRRRANCLFCPRSRHSGQPHDEFKFSCLLCRDKRFNKSTGVCQHLEEFHKIQGKGGDEPPTLRLAKDGFIRVPRDVRRLTCRWCGIEFLAQDRQTLIDHLNGPDHALDVPKHVIKYQCRVCDLEFESGKEFRLHPCCVFAEKQKRTQEVEKWRCSYCNADVEVTSKASHRATHTRLDFDCEIGTCTRSFMLMPELIEHLSTVHDEDVPSSVTAIELSDKRMVRLPRDLRKLDCPFCPEIFLCQGQQVLLKHVEAKHSEKYENGMYMRSDLAYSCRSCSSRVLSMDGHPCTFKINGRPNRAPEQVPSQPDKRFQRNADTQLSEESSAKRDSSGLANGPGGDLRRLTCKMCSEAFNQTGFYSIIRHLEKDHHKFQISRQISMEDFVIFGCAKCNDNLMVSSVHKWSQHFSSDFCDCKGCEGPVLKRTKATEKVGLPARDARKAKCLLCEKVMSNHGRSDLEGHLKSCHDISPLDTQALDRVLELGCGFCEDFSADCLDKWDQHFYKACEGSRRQMVKLPDVGGRNVSDLRKMACTLCDYTAHGSRIFEMLHHLTKDHDRGSARAEEFIVFGCSNCPNFRPKTAQLWDHHFGKDYGVCQANSNTCKRDQTATFWCDACSETRHDIESHFKGEFHRSNVDRCVTTQFDGDGNSVLMCDACDIKFTTQANYNLHQFLSHAGS